MLELVIAVLSLSSAGIFAAHAIEAGHSSRDELERIAGAWRDWSADEDGWLLMPHGEIIARA